MNSRGKSKIVVILAVALVGGLGLIAYNCGSQPVKLEIKQTNSAPVGTIQGRVRDINTGQPLANVEVKTLLGGGWVSVRTNTTGDYAIGGLGATSYNVYFSLSGYGTRIINGVAVPSVVGGFWPAENQIVTLDTSLYPADSALDVTVVRTATCGCSITGAAGMTVTINLLGNTVPFDLEVSATTDANSIAHFTGLPARETGLQYDAGTIRVLSVDCNGDGVNDMQGAATGATTLFSKGKRLLTANIGACI